MHSKADIPCLLERYFSGIRDLLPAVDALISRHESTTLRDYVEALGEKPRAPFQCHRDFVDEVANYTRATLGPELGSVIAEELREAPQVLTANHHGIDTFAQSTQSNLLFSLRRRDDGTAMKTIPVLACGSVPLNNLTYPRGLLVYACNQARGAGAICRLPIFPDSQKRKLVSVAAPFTGEMLQRARTRANKLVESGQLIGPVGPALDTVFDDFSRIGQSFPDYARQATVVNHRLWRRLFRKPARQTELVYIELENIACRLLELDLFDPATICHQLLFDPGLRRSLIENLDGQRGCWQTDKLARRADRRAAAPALDSAMGTMFFWGVDAKGRQVPLLVYQDRESGVPELRGVDDGGNHWSLPFTPEGIVSGLRQRLLLPSIFTSYLLISIARGVNCIGGYYQADYLPVMHRAVSETLGLGGGESGTVRGGFGPDLYLSGMQAVGVRLGDRLLPAGPVEIIASGGFDEEQYARIGDVTVMQSHFASLLDFVLDVAPGSHDFHRVGQDISRLVHDKVGPNIVTISMAQEHDSGQA